MLERVGLLLGLSEASNTPGQRTTVTFVLPSCTGVITKLSSLNCSNRYVNTTRFDVFVAHFVAVVGPEFACFGAGRVLVRDFSYGYRCISFCLQIQKESSFMNWQWVTRREGTAIMKLRMTLLPSFFSFAWDGKEFGM